MIDTTAYSPTNERKPMSWYTIAWRETGKRHISLEVPGLQEWCQSTMIPQPGGLTSELRPGPVRLCWLIRKWLGNFEAPFETDDSDTIFIHDGIQYFLKTSVIPEHCVPQFEYWGDGEGDDELVWVIELPNEMHDYRTVLSISQHENVGKAMRQAKKDAKHWFENVGELDIKQWQSDSEQLRLDYEHFRHWVNKTYGVMPPDPEPIGKGERGFSK